MEPTIDQRLRAFWHECGAVPRSGLNRDQLAACEHRLGRILPSEIASFYLGVNGTRETGPELFVAWPLGQVGSVPDVVSPFRGIPDYGDVARFLPEAADYFAFADSMIWSNIFAVRLSTAVNTTTQVVWLCGSSYAVVAPTFVEFWERYLANPSKVLCPAASTIRSPAG